MWTETTRKNYDHKEQRYASDLTCREGEFIEPHLPAKKTTGRPRSAITGVSKTGCIGSWIWCFAMMNVVSVKEAHRLTLQRSNTPPVTCCAP